MIRDLMNSFVMSQAGWADALGAFFQRLFGAIYRPIPPLKDFLHGVWLGHPLHPLLSDVPVGAFVAAFVLDASSVARPEFADLRRAAAWVIGVGILGMLAAALAGYADYLDLEGRDRTYGSVHSMLMLVSLVLYVLSFAFRVNWIGTPFASADVAFQIAGLLVLTVAAYIGGDLVFAFGLQVSRHAWRGGGDKWVALEVGDIPEDTPQQAKAGAQTLVVVRHGGMLYAMHDLCSHMACNLSDGGRVVGDAIECPCHGSRFRLRDGRAVRGPAVFSQPQFAVRTADGRTEVKRV